MFSHIFSENNIKWQNTTHEPASFWNFLSILRILACPARHKHFKFPVMKNRFHPLIFFLLLASWNLTAQKKMVDPQPFLTQTIDSRAGLFTVPFPTLESRNVVDTLVPDAFNDVCGDVQVLYQPVDDWGFIGGTNFFGDKEKAQLIENTTNTSITIKEAWALFGYVSSVGNGNVRMKIYRVDPDGGPGSMRAQTNDVRVENIEINDTAVVATPFFFPVTVDLDEPSFYLSLDISGLYNTFDTVAVFSTELGCGSGREAYDLWQNDQWFPVVESWGGLQDFDINYSLLAIVEFDDPNSVNDPYFQQGLLRLYPAAPNPAREQVRLNYELEEPGPVQIEIYSSDGRRLQLLELGHQGAGRHRREINTGHLPAGSYVYTILTDRARVASRFIVK